MNEKEKLINEAYEALKKASFNGMIIAPTGTGKGLIMIKCLNYLVESGFTKILYCCDNINLRDNDFPNELIKWGKKHYLNFIERKCYQGVYKKLNEIYDVVLLDEADYMFDTIYEDLLKNNSFKYKIAVSATLSSYKRESLKKYSIPIVLDVKMSEIEGKGVVNKVQPFLVHTLLTIEENRKYLQYNERFKRLNESPNSFHLTKLQTERKTFMGKLKSSRIAIKKLITHILKNEDNKVLVFVGYTEQANKVSDYAYHTQNNDSKLLEDFNSGLIKQLAVVGKINRGVNLNRVTHGIYELSSSSKTLITQQTGRIRRLKINENAILLFIIPHFKDMYSNIKPTIIQKYFEESTEDLGLDIDNIKVIKLY